MTNNSTFIFKGFSILEKEGKILFNYSILHKNTFYDFTESLILPGEFDLNKIPQDLLKELLQNILLILGISYWKTFCPKIIQIEGFALTENQAKFWNTVYTKGLGEFFYTNKIDFRGLINFPFDKDKKESPISYPRQNRSLLPLGGGKDSIVAAELLKKLGKEFMAVTFYTGLTHSVAQEKVIEKMNVESLKIRRILDPKLLKLNKRKDVYNGHIPAVAMHSFISIMLALVYDYRFVIFANEESASYGNVEYLGETANHQWSKSLEFEEMFQKYLKENVTDSIQYFSILRPFSEIKIAQIFSGLSDYFPVFVSCNKGYTMAKKGNTNWCCNCPKCAFVFAILAAFLPKESVLKIFGRNLFTDRKLLPLFKALLEVGKIKPFECVGTPEEVRIAFYYALGRKEWDQTLVMNFFVKTILPEMKAVSEMQRDSFMLLSHRIPDEFLDVLKYEN